MKLFRSLFSSSGCDKATAQASTPDPSVHQAAVQPEAGPGASAGQPEPTPAPAPAPPPVATVIGESTSCPEGARLHAKIDGRYVTVVRVNGKVSCIDSICFHAGGPLGVGDIEEVNGKQCIVCPWHFYKIDLETGDKYYQTMDFKEGKMVGGDWKSNGIRQRTHRSWEEDGKIYVELSITEKPTKENYVESDGYAFDKNCGDRMLNSPPSANRSRVHSVGGDGKKPSGQVLRGQYHTK